MILPFSVPKSGHSRKRRSVSNSTVTNSTSYVSYDVSGWTTGCRVWDGQQWDKTSCQVLLYTIDTCISFHSIQSSHEIITNEYRSYTRITRRDNLDLFFIQVSQETNNKETVCDCKNPPGDNFATSFFVPPNSIDFSTVFEKFDIIGNGAVFGTVTAIIVLYVIGLLVGRRYDRKDREKVSDFVHTNIDDVMYWHIVLLSLYHDFQWSDF